MDFASWTARIATPPAGIEAIRRLRAGASVTTASCFALKPDGSFELDVAWFVVTALWPYNDPVPPRSDRKRTVRDAPRPVSSGGEADHAQWLSHRQSHRFTFFDLADTV
jgi:hypothetical protein